MLTISSNETIDLFMNTTAGLDKCLPFISSQLQNCESPTRINHDVTQRPAITVSRQTGSGAHSVGQKLVELLQDADREGAFPWTLFDRDLVEKVLEDHHHPARFARFLPEDRISGVTEAMDELLGGHPPSRVLINQTAQTIRRLVDRGNVVLIGRGANVVTRGLSHVFHVRLVGSLQKRVERIQEILGLREREARDFILKEDRGRQRYLKKYFQQELDDPLLYHMVVNTDLMPYDEVARLIAESVLSFRGVELGQFMRR